MPHAPNEPARNDARDKADRLERLARALADHRTLTLLWHERAWALGFIIEGRTGRLLLPAPHAVLEEPDEDVSVFIPEEGQGALQAALALTAVADPADRHAGAALDRWQAYHGSPAHPAWAWGAITTARLDDAFAAGDEFDLRNPLADVEPRLCRLLNADRPALAALARRLARVEVPAPVAVGVDPRGVDLRAEFGMLRLAFDRPITDPASAEESLKAWLR